MWTGIIILLVAAAGLAIWMGAKKDKENESASAPEAVDAMPEMTETPIESEEEKISEDSEDRENPSI